MKPIAGNMVADRYELVERISRTQMSMVFKAWDSLQKSFVAVKIATNHILCGTLVERLQCEGRALQMLDHPRIVRLLDSGHIDGSYFLVLEYLPGINLAACLKETVPLPLDIAISIAVEMLEGLEAVHQAGLVHRDIKPENLIITSRGIKLIDFALARFVNAADRPARRLTNPGTTMGTLPYLSPEQAYDSSEVDARSDLYVCGVVLYEVLTGVLPFPKFFENGIILKYWDMPMRLFSEASSLAIIPDEIRAIVWKALSRNPDERYQTAEEMRAALLAVKPSIFKQFLEKPKNQKILSLLDDLLRTSSEDVDAH